MSDVRLAGLELSLTQPDTQPLPVIVSEPGLAQATDGPAATGAAGAHGGLAQVRIAVVMPDDDPRDSWTTPYSIGLAEHLAARGAHVRVVTQGRSPEPPPGRRPTAEADPAAPEVVAVRRRATTRPLSIGRLLPEAVFAFGTRRRIREHRPQVVVARVPSLTGAATATFTARELGVPCVLLLQDLASGVQRPGQGDQLSAGAHLVSSLRQAAFRRASSITVPSPAFVPLLHELAPGVPVAVVPFWPAMSAEELPQSSAQDADEQRRRMRRRLGWEGRFVVAHTGNIGTREALEDLAPALHHLAVALPGVLVSFLGQGSRRPVLEQATAGLPSVEVRDPLPATDASAVLRAADVLLVHERSTSREAGLPGRLAAYLRAGRPILAVVRDDSATAVELASSGAGLTVTPHDAAAFVAGLASLRDDPEFRDGLAAAGRRFARDTLDSVASLDQLTQLIHDVLRARRDGLPIPEGEVL